MKNYHAFFLLFLVFSSCKKKVEIINESTPEVTNYLVSYTRGMIELDEDIFFQFQSDLVIDSTALEESIKVTPKLDYTLDFDQATNTVFIRPVKDLPRGQNYQIEFLVSNLIDIKKRVKLESEVSIQKQYVSVYRKGLILNEGGEKQLLLDINTSSAVSADDVESMFSSSVPVSVTALDEYNFEAQIDLTDDISAIEWSGQSLQSDDQGTIEVWSGDFDSFRVFGNYYDKDRKEFTAYFTKRLDEKQDAKGLILLAGNPASFEIKDNVVKIFVNSLVSDQNLIEIKKGLLSVTGEKFSSDFSYEVDQQMLQPRVEWMSEGNYLPESGEFYVPFKARGLNAVQIAVAEIPQERAGQFVAWNPINSTSRYELLRHANFVFQDVINLEEPGIDLTQWNEFGIDLSDTFQRSAGSIYRIFLHFTPNQTAISCQNFSLGGVSEDLLDQSFFDRKYEDYQYYNYSERNNPCNAAYYAYNPPIEKNVHATNVFPIVKKGSSKVIVAVKELVKSNYASGAKVSLISLQGKAFAEQSVRKSGVAIFENIQREALAIRIDYQNKTSYFSLDESEINPLTEFDVSSDISAADHQLFIYSERDIRRPGDSIYLNVMLNRVDADFPDGLPLRLEVYNPKGTLYASEIQEISEEDLIYSFAVDTKLEDPTGNWRAEVSAGPIKTSETVRIETIQPNVVEVEFELNGKEENWLYSSTINGNAHVEYLAGYPLVDGKVKTTMNVYPLAYPFSEYSEYLFTGLKTEESKKELKLFEGNTNSQGNVSVNNDIDFKEFNTVVNLIVDTEVELPGGGLNSQSIAWKVSPFSSYVGIRKNQGSGWRGSYIYGEIPRFNLIHLNQKGEKNSGSSKGNATLYKAKSDWWYDRYRLSDTYNVHSTNNYELIDQFSINFSNGESKYEHNATTGSGVYVLRLEDPESGHFSEYRYHVVTVENYEVDNNPVFLNLDIENENVSIGDDLKLKLPEMPEAKAFVSIEKGDKIINSFWMDLDSPDLQVKVEKDWYPNVFVHVSVVQNYGDRDQGRPMRMYGVRKVKIDERNEILEPEIKSKDKVAPNNSFNITVSEKTGKPMQYTLAVVDRGLLSLTGFPTPDPISHFSRQVSLLVDTWDIYDELIYSNDPSFAGVYSIGGDAMLLKMDENADFSRFEPVVFHLGPFDLKKNGKNNHQINLPNYMGNVRLMVVAVNENTFGSAEKDVRVVNPIMLQSQFPRALNVTDKVKLPVTVFKDEPKINHAKITAKSSNSNLIQFGAFDSEISLRNQDQQLTYLPFSVGDKAGPVNIDLGISSGNYQSKEETQIFVNYPNSYESNSTFIEIKPGEEENIQVSAFGFPETQHVQLSVSGLLMPDFVGQYESLIDYPYGCLEQVSSRAFSLLFVPNIVSLPAGEKAESENFLDDAFRAIYRNQQADGSFKYWDNGYYHQWSDIYAGHLLIEAKRNGKQVNTSVLENWLRFTDRTANRWNVEGVNNQTLREEEMIQAYRLFVLALANQPAKSAMNRLRGKNLVNEHAKTLLGGAYMLAGMNSVGEELILNASRAEKDNSYRYATFNSKERNRAIELMMLSLLENKQHANQFYRQFVQNVNNSSWLSTQEKGFIAMACSYYIDQNNLTNSQSSYSYDYSVGNESSQKSMKRGSVHSYQFTPQQMGQSAKIRNTGDASIFVHKTERAIPTEMYSEAEQNQIALTVNYSGMNGQNLSLGEVRQGEDILISIGVRNASVTDLNSLALTLKMPSGWELLNPRLMQTKEASSENSRFTEQDFRDDKVYTYFELNTGQTKNFTFRAKANLVGDFYLPAVQCEDMYMGNVFAKTKAARTIVQE